MFEPKGPGDKIPMVLVELLIGVQLFGDEDLEEIVNEFSLERLDRLELEEMVEEECLGIGQRRDDAPLSLLASLAGVLRRVRAKKFDHDLKESQSKFKFNWDENWTQ